MSSPELPKIRVIAVPIARVVLLGQIGHQLRSYYQDLMEEPIPDRLEQLARRFAES
ncbi:NepR family anti-sigma factor [Microvirga massiliensis]|uniref:NepR family anti-sigma factor n=1 Tax=Microvirga massiliensis TaxID=1033741 RepID=UPI000AE1F23A|nr:NepR family anti-sigma factor [Microvirga massiliensis]